MLRVPHVLGGSTELSTLIRRPVKVKGLTGSAIWQLESEPAAHSRARAGKCTLQRHCRVEECDSGILYITGHCMGGGGQCGEVRGQE